MKKQVLVTVDRGETRVAMLEAAGEVTAARRSRRRKKGGLPTGYRVAEAYFERRGGRSIVGNIYKGRVDNVLPGLEAAFVDFGLEKNGFLHVDDALVDVADDRAASAALEVDLGGAVALGHRAFLGALTGARLGRGGGLARGLQHCDAGLPTVDRDQHLLSQGDPSLEDGGPSLGCGRFARLRVDGVQQAQGQER